MIGIPDPQPEIFAIVAGDGNIGTRAPSRRWAFKSLTAAQNRALDDRLTGEFRHERNTRVARYVFAGWA